MKLKTGTADIRSFTVLGHRGAKGYAPENTLSSFVKAIELGATMAELDVHLSRDRQLVVMHDAKVDRTTNGSGAIRDLTVAELKRLDAGGWFGPQFGGAKVPVLQEVIEATRERILLNIEVKHDAENRLYDGLSELLAESLVTNAVVDKVVISSFDAPYLRELRRLLPGAHLALLYSKPIADPCQLALDEGWEALHPNQRLVERELTERAHAAGLLVRGWNPNEVADMVVLIEKGVDGIGTDYPDRLLALARQHGKLQA